MEQLFRDETRVGMVDAGEGGTRSPQELIKAEVLAHAEPDLLALGVKLVSYTIKSSALLLSHHFCYMMHTSWTCLRVDVPSSSNIGLNLAEPLNAIIVCCSPVTRYRHSLFTALSLSLSLSLLPPHTHAHTHSLIHQHTTSTRGSLSSRLVSSQLMTTTGTSRRSVSLGRPPSLRSLASVKSAIEETR